MHFEDKICKASHFFLSFSMLFLANLLGICLLSLLITCPMIFSQQLDVIGIDEAQFFGDLYEFCRRAADQEGKTVIVAGLDGDYLRFTPSGHSVILVTCYIIVKISCSII